MGASFDDLKLLITEAIEGAISAERMTLLNRMLAESGQARRFYCEFMEIHVLTEHMCSEKLFFDEKTPAVESDAARHDLLLHALAEEEKRADSVDIELPQMPSEPERIVVSRRRPPRRVSKTPLVWMAVSAAAMLMLVLFAQFGPRRTGYQVATVTDSLNAEWADGAMPAGTRLVASYTPHYLKKGFVELLFDNHTEVVIEAPAEFQIIADDQIKLTYGRVFAIVPPEAIGFTVTSQRTKIIDLGTEFGVYSDRNGGLELHVLKGKTLLLPENKTGIGGMEVTAGAAKKITSVQTLMDIPCDKRVFARGIDSQRNMVWRGQKWLDLADMIIGGDGQNANRGMAKIDLTTGKRTGLLFVNAIQKNPGFQASDINEFIDGVFIPDQGDGQVISTTGIRFEDCPDTNGTAFYHISTFREIPSIGSDVRHSLKLTHKSADTDSTLLLHPNAGISYDLDAIRRAYPAHQVTSFVADCGFPIELSEKRAASAGNANIAAAEAGSAEFFVLLDGRVQTKLSINMFTKPQALQIPISADDRFLSLVSTDGNQNINFDWVVLENAMLVLEEH
jgi:hypothetical protein